MQAFDPYGFYLTLLVIVLLFFVLMFVAAGIKVLKEWERVAILRLGKFQGIKGPGVIFIVPLLDKIAMKVSLRLLTYAFKTERSLTKDNVPVVVPANGWGDMLEMLAMDGWDDVDVIVIDSLTIVERLCTDWIIENVSTGKGRATSIESYAYGKGYRFIHDEFNAEPG